MFKQSVWTSVVSAQLAAHHLAPGGTLVLTGALAAREGTPGMIGYGMAKVHLSFLSFLKTKADLTDPSLQSAVHHLVTSLAQPGSGMPEGSHALGVLPVTLDTPMNRKYMPDANHSSWTPLETLVS